MNVNDKYVQRLYKEWLQHGRIILAIDFDNTVSPYHTLDNKEDMDRAVKAILDSQQVGTYNMIHTSCDPSRHEDIVVYCSGLGIRIDAINATPIEVPYGKPGSKPYFNISLDDRCGLREATITLETAMVLVRAAKASIVLDNPGSTEF